MDASSLRGPGLWELAVLSLLRERAMHPYEILRLLKLRHKDDVLVLKRGSLYHAIRRLEAAALITAQKTSRAGRRPERTTYALTSAGRRALIDSLKQFVAVPHHERSEYMGALSFLVHLTPDEAAAGLEHRVEMLDQEIARLEATLAEATPRIGRIHVIESEYARAMLVAQRAWTSALVGDLQKGRFTWDLEAMLKHLRSSAARARRTKDTSS